MLAHVIRFHGTTKEIETSLALSSHPSHDVYNNHTQNNSRDIEKTDDNSATVSQNENHLIDEWVDFDHLLDCLRDTQQSIQSSVPPPEAQPSTTDSNLDTGIPEPHLSSKNLDLEAFVSGLQ